MNINLDKNNNMMMRSTALTIFLLHILYISLVRGFIPSSSSSFHHRHVSYARIQATRQDDMIATVSKTTRAYTSSSSRVMKPAPSSRSLPLRPHSNTNNSNNQYTQFFKDNVLVGIQRTSPNSRRISGEMIMNIPIDAIWSIITDYDNLSVHVPNLVESRVIRRGKSAASSSSSSSSPRVYQRGAQRIFGFEFGADVTMDMKEYVHLSPSSSVSEVDGQGGTLKQCVIDFKCVDSQFFSEFDGSWIVEEYKDEDGVSSASSSSSSSSSDDDVPITMVRYVVDVRPKGPVPVAALEWRIKEDVPVNILAVSKAATAVMMRQQLEEQKQRQEKVRNLPPNTVSYQQQQIPSTLPTSPTPSRRQRRQSPLQLLGPPSFQPLQRLTNQAATNFKRTAKTVLPAPVYSTAQQAMNIINNNLPRPRRSSSSSDDAMVVVPSMSLQTGGSSNAGNDIKTNTLASITSSGNTSKDVDVDWYDDETMAMYL